MTAKDWITVMVALVSIANLIALRLVAVGRWAQKMETDSAESARADKENRKRPVTLERLGWEIEAIAKDIKDLRGMFDTRYSELAGKVTADHQDLRDLRNWRAGLLTELGEHFHPIGIVDRMVRESEADRKSIHERLSLVETIVNRRADLRP